MGRCHAVIRLGIRSAKPVLASQVGVPHERAAMRGPSGYSPPAASAPPFDLIDLGAPC